MYEYRISGTIRASPPRRQSADKTVRRFWYFTSSEHLINGIYFGNDHTKIKGTPFAGVFTSPPSHTLCSISRMAIMLRKKCFWISRKSNESPTIVKFVVLLIILLSRVWRRNPNWQKRMPVPPEVKLPARAGIMLRTEWECIDNGSQALQKENARTNLKY